MTDRAALADADGRDRRRAGAARAWSSGASAWPGRRSGASATRPTGAGRCPGSAIRTRGSCCSGSRRRPTAATGPGGSSPATPRATSCGRRSMRAGLADRPASRRADDGLTLTDAYIAAAVRCAPPANKPTPSERDTCAPFLEREIRLLDRLVVVVALGQFGWDAALRAFDGARPPVPPEAPVRPRARGRRSGRTGCSGRTTRASRTPSPDG